MARHRLGRADGQTPGMILENPFDGLGFDRIIQRRGRAVRIDVVHLRRVDSRLPQGLFQRPSVTQPFRMRIGGMIGFATSAVPGNFRVNPRPASHRMGQFLQNKKGRAFAQHETIARLVKGPHGPRRFASCSDMARSRQKPICIISIISSDPPATTTSASSIRIMLGRVTDGVIAGSAARTISHRVAVDSQVQADGAAAFPAIARHHIVGMQRPVIVLAR